MAIHPNLLENGQNPLDLPLKASQTLPIHPVSLELGMNPLDLSQIHLYIPIMFLHTPFVHMPVNSHSFISAERKKSRLYKNGKRKV